MASREETGGGKAYYSVLGLASNASSCAIRNAYRKLAMKWHPDKCGSEDQAGAKLKFQEIQEAYAVLSDSRKKTLYDSGLLDPNDDDEDIEGLSCFLNEMTGMMAEVQASEKAGKGSSFEELQQLFVDIFSTDFKMAALNRSSSHPSMTAQSDKKRNWSCQGLGSFQEDSGFHTRDMFCPSQKVQFEDKCSPSLKAHIYFTDPSHNGNANTNAFKRQKNTLEDNLSLGFELPCDNHTFAMPCDKHTWGFDATTSHYNCSCRKGLGQFRH